MQSLREQQRQKDRVLQQERYEDAKRRAFEETNPDEQRHKLNVERDNIIRMIPEDVRGERVIQDLVKRRLADFAEKENNRHNDFNSTLKLDQRNKEQAEEAYDEIQLLFEIIYDKIKAKVTTNLYDDLAKLKRLVFSKIYFLNERQLSKVLQDINHTRTFINSGYSFDVINELHMLLQEYEKKSKHKSTSQRKHILEDLKHESLKDKFKAKTRVDMRIPGGPVAVPVTRGRAVTHETEVARAPRARSTGRQVSFSTPPNKDHVFLPMGSIAPPSTGKYATPADIFVGKPSDFTPAPAPTNKSFDFNSAFVEDPQTEERVVMKPRPKTTDELIVKKPSKRPVPPSTGKKGPLDTEGIDALALMEQAPAPLPKPHARKQRLDTEFALLPPPPPKAPIGAAPSTRDSDDDDDDDDVLVVETPVKAKPLSWAEAVKSPPIVVAPEPTTKIVTYKGHTYEIPRTLVFKWGGATLAKHFGNIPITDPSTGKPLSLRTDVPHAKEVINGLFYTGK